MELGSDFFTRTEQAIKQAAQAQAQAIAHGGLDNFSEYKMACGVIKGLDLALSIIENVLETISKENRHGI